MEHDGVCKGCALWNNSEGSFPSSDNRSGLGHYTFKYEFFNKFQELKALVENIFGKKINFFTSNNGGEYTSNEFK